MGSDYGRGVITGAVMPGDVVVLWCDLTFNYVTDLRMSLEPILGLDGKAYLRVSVWSVRYDDDHPHGYEYCWATKDYPSLGYSISPTALFELLIVAKASIVHALDGSCGN